MIDCLEHAVTKENEIPRIIEMIFNKLSNNSETIGIFNKKMRSTEEIMKDYGLM